MSQIGLGSFSVKGGFDLYIFVFFVGWESFGVTQAKIIAMAIHTLQNWS